MIKIDEVLEIILKLSDENKKAMYYFLLGLSSQEKSNEKRIDN